MKGVSGKQCVGQAALLLGGVRSTVGCGQIWLNGQVPGRTGGGGQRAFQPGWREKKEFKKKAKKLQSKKQKAHWNRGLRQKIREKIWSQNIKDFASPARVGMLSWRPLGRPRRGQSKGT